MYITNGHVTTILINGICLMTVFLEDTVEGITACFRKMTKLRERVREREK